jgi:hypothetical protein
MKNTIAHNHINHQKLMLAVPLTAAAMLAASAPAQTMTDTNSAAGGGASQAQAMSAPANAAPPACPVADYFSSWFTRVSAIQAEQPHWITPLVTVTPRLEEELRYDQAWQAAAGGHSLDNYDSGKGVELIPCENVELIIGVPAWETETEGAKPAKTGWSDQSFLVKYRILSANEEKGDYILTAFLGLSVPDGSDSYSSHHYTVTPTLAGGKGWGDFDVQSTLGLSVSDNGAVRAGAGTPLAWNTAFQYRVEKYFSPEVEANYTWWPNGEHGGKSQLYLTPGLLIGRVPIAGRVGLTFGAGFQVAVTDKPLDHRNIVLTARLPF